MARKFLTGGRDEEEEQHQHTIDHIRTDCRNLFQLFDRDGDGKLSPAELCATVRATTGEDLSHEEMTRMVASADLDGDGLLDLDEVVELVRCRREEADEDLMGAFRVYEMEGEECITPTSLRRALRRLGDEKSIEECENMISKFDLNGDGVLNFHEFKIMML